MTELTLVKESAEILDLLGNYELLIHGNNALKLKLIENNFEPYVVSSETKIIDFNSKTRELGDKIHEAANQLKEHYDDVANDDEVFQSCWDQNPTFTEGVNKFPKVQMRKFFDSYAKFFEKNAWEERISLNDRLNNFEPFYTSSEMFYDSNTQKRFSSPKKLESMLKKSTNGKVGACCTSVITTFAGLGAGYVLSSTLQGTAPPGFNEFVGTYGVGLFALTVVALQSLPSWIGRENEVENFKQYVHNTLSYRAEKADKIISLIKTVAD